MFNTLYKLYYSIGLSDAKLDTANLNNTGVLIFK